MDGSPLTRKVIYRCQMVIQGQGHFNKSGLPLVIPPVVWNEVNIIEKMNLQSPETNSHVGHDPLTPF